MIQNIIPSCNCLMRMFVQTLNTIKFSGRIFTFIIFLCVGQSSWFVGSLSSKAGLLSELAAFGNISAFSAFKYIIKFQHLLKLKFRIYRVNICFVSYFYNSQSVLSPRLMIKENNLNIFISFILHSSRIITRRLLWINIYNLPISFISKH